MENKFYFLGEHDASIYKELGEGVIKLPQNDFAFDQWGRPLNIMDPVVLERLVNGMKVDIGEVNNGLHTNYHFLRISPDKNSTKILGRSNSGRIILPLNLLKKIGLDGEATITLTGQGEEKGSFHIWSPLKRKMFYFVGLETGAITC
jgi:hypothetical protein